MPKKRVRAIKKKSTQQRAAEKRAQTIAKKQMKIKLEVLELLCSIPVVRVVAAKAGISTSTLYRYMEEDADFAHDVEKSKQIGVQEISDIAESKVISGIHRGDKTFVIFWLKNRHKAYADKLRHDHRHKFEPTITPERQQQIVDAIRRWEQGKRRSDDEDEIPTQKD